MSKTAERLIFQGACFTLLCSLTSSPWALGVEPPWCVRALGSRSTCSFPINLGPSEALSEQCLRADVQAGDARVPAGLLQMRLEGEPPQLRARLTSAVRWTSRGAGQPGGRCPSRFTREFMALLEQAPAPAPARCEASGACGLAGGEAGRAPACRSACAPRRSRARTRTHATARERGPARATGHQGPAPSARAERPVCSPQAAHERAAAPAPGCARDLAATGPAREPGRTTTA